MDTPQTIGIAVVEHDGCYLVGTRRDEGPLRGFAEFPGGKCHPGETPRDCAVRECREESGLNVAADELLLQHEFAYPHATVDLHFWLCRPVDSESVCDEHRGFRWVEPRELGTLHFPAANEPLIELLVSR